MTISISIYLIRGLVERESILAFCSSLILVLASISFMILPLKESIMNSSEEDFFKYKIISKQWLTKEFLTITPHIIFMSTIIVVIFIFTSNEYSQKANADSDLSNLFFSLGLIAMNIENIFI